MRRIKLTKAWAGRKAGAELRVWEPGDELKPGMVDPARGDYLLQKKLAEVVPDAPKASSAPATAPQTADGGIDGAQGTQATTKRQKARG
jgi:hypothetical protein